MRSLWRWLRGRHADVGPADVALGYARDQVPMLDVLALLQVIGIAATLVTHPHVVRRDVLVLRHGRRVHLTVPPAAVESVRLERRYHGGRIRQQDGDEPAAVVGNQTDVVLSLSEPVCGVRGVRFRADDPRAAYIALTSAVART